MNDDDDDVLTRTQTRILHSTVCIIKISHPLLRTKLVEKAKEGRQFCRHRESSENTSVGENTSESRQKRERSQSVTAREKKGKLLDYLV